MHEPRVKYGLGLGYALSPTGADHMHSFHDRDFDNEGGLDRIRSFGIIEPLEIKDLGPAKMRMAATAIPWNTVGNVLGQCFFVAATFDAFKLVQLVRAITGWDTSLYELHKAGERAYNMARAFNAREGFTADDDKIPARFFEPFKEGPSTGNALPSDEFESARAIFYQMMGWDERGVPTAWKLHELGVGWVADELRRHGVLS